MDGSGWSEVDVALRDSRREVKLCGSEAARRLQSAGGLLPAQLFALPLNLLTLTELQLEKLPSELARLGQLKSLLVFNTGLIEFPEAALKLRELSVLDLSRNQIPTVPELSCLSHLSTINLSGNQLEQFPACLLPKLLLLDLSRNRLTQFPDICRKENSHLADLKLNCNGIVDIPAEVNSLPALKNLDLAENQIKLVPKELSEIPRLKEINLKGNKLNDNRLLKLVDQCRSKQIIDYIRQTCPKASSAELNASGKISKKNIKKQQQKKNETVDDVESEDAALDSLCDKMYVLHCSDDTPNVKINDSVKAIRPHIVCCIVRGLSFTEDTFKKFIQMQTKLHDTICEKRHAATIATHDLLKIPPGDLLYTARQPFSIVIQPLNRAKTYSGLELYSQLRKEAEDLRKEKKRNVYSGIHKYLYLLEGKSLYPCLLDSKNNTISFPPITNSDVTKMSHETTSMIVEVTSSQNQTICRKVLDTFLMETLNMGVGGRSDGDDQQVNNRLGTSHKLDIQQMKIVDYEGKMKVIYPSKVDLYYEEKNNLKIIRE